MPAIDIFKGDAFSLIELTSAVNKLPHKPGRIGQLGVFFEKGIATTKAFIEERAGRLYLVQSVPRGGVPQVNLHSSRRVMEVPTLHLPLQDRLNADELQDVRAFGSPNQLESVQPVLTERMSTMTRSIEATLEWQRLGALRGKVLDADGTEVLDLFSLFQVAQPTEVDFDLDNASPAPGAIRGKCSNIIRAMEDELEETPLGGVTGLCGKTFFDALVDHPETREAYQRWNAGEYLRERTARRTFYYAGITFEEYRGKVGNTQFVADDKCHFFPTGTDGVFQTVFAPANYIETVNTIGLPYYAKTVADEAGRWVDLHVQSNPLSYCTRPRTLIQGKRT